MQKKDIHLKTTQTLKNNRQQRNTLKT